MKLKKILFYTFIISLIFSIGKTFGDDKTEYDELYKNIRKNCDDEMFEIRINGGTPNDRPVRYGPVLPPNFYTNNKTV